MAIFSIKDIEAVSGIKCHTLRIWEQRYGIIQPKRTETNIRYYDDEDLRYIINISILNRHGYKISEIAKMTRAEITEAIQKYLGISHEHQNHIKGLVSAMLSFDEYQFQRILNTCILQLGLEQAMTRVFFPFLNEVGVLWQIGSIHPSHEHFASGIIKQKLYVAIDGQVGKYAPNRKRFLLFLPEREQHSIGLLFANYLLRSRGHDVVYLGQNVPVSDLKDACLGLTPDYVFTTLTCACLDLDKQDFINSLSSYWKHTQIMVAGIQFLNCDLHYPENVRVIRRIEDFVLMVESISTGKNVA